MAGTSGCTTKRNPDWRISLLVHDSTSHDEAPAQILFSALLFTCHVLLKVSQSYKHHSQS